MKRNKLSHKKAEMISSARKLNTTNPFIIYGFFDQLEECDGNYCVYELTCVSNMIYCVILS